MNLRSKAQQTPTWLVTGGYGFIGSAFIRLALRQRPDLQIINLDALTYAGNPANLDELGKSILKRHHFVHGSINNKTLVGKLLKGEVNGLIPSKIINFAAESHVDRSILGPAPFIKTNIEGTQTLLWQAHLTWKKDDPDNEFFRFCHISTDEVYGTLGPKGKFTEKTPLAPNSPYSASKASADLLVRAMHETFGMNAVTTRCCNNYGPYHFPEKLIPLMITKAMNNQALPIYGDGQQVRDWIHVDDHAAGVLLVLEKGKSGRVYNISAHQERTNLQVVHALLNLLGKDESLISYVQDRPGHDRRYALDASRLMKELGYRPATTFEQGLAQTVDWYKSHQKWVKGVLTGDYLNYLKQQYHKR